MTSRVLSHPSVDVPPARRPADVADLERRESLSEKMHRVTVEVREEISQAVTREFNKPPENR